jgi:7,8-dihydro-6-hydroxymethylpterin dimethyltransferase
VLREDGILIPTTHRELARQPSEKEAAEKAKDYVRRHWKYYHPDSAASGGSHNEDLMERIHSYSLCISGMAFQDAWNIDLERLQRCCIHVATAQQQLIPLCIYYLTDAGGRRFIGRKFQAPL